ncbi:MAG: hypothetical protein ACK4UN_08505 [Limisphaerales bacterium]
MKLKAIQKSLIYSLCYLIGITGVSAIAPGDVIINEVYFSNKGGGPGHYEAVELLVVADKLNLNGLQISDRDLWHKPAEYQCTINDMGQGFLSSVRSGTLIVIYDGPGTDVIDTNNFVLKLYTQSSLFCNTAPGTNGFSLVNKADNLHLVHLNKQIDFVKYQVAGANTRAPGDPGTLSWDNGGEGHIVIDADGGSTGFRFLGNKPELNDYPAAWHAYSEKYTKVDNLGKPNGGANTEWIERLRQQTQFQTNIVRNRE